MATAKRILVVEDESDLADLVAYNLRRVGYEVEVAKDGQTALRRAMELPPDLVLLDVMIPQISGIQVARQLRTHPKTATLPIVMVTAKAEEVDQVSGLQVGADDYITKPFSMVVLLARVEAILRRARGGAADAADLITMRGVEADLATHELRVEGEPVKMTLTEFRLLVALMRGRGKVLSREDLMYTAMGPDVVVTSRTIDVHMAAIRKKLGAAGGMIRTIRGVGYILDDKNESVEAELTEHG
jgi:two-component system phosphate regulon response regulator PhoB